MTLSGLSREARLLYIFFWSVCDDQNQVRLEVDGVPIFKKHPGILGVNSVDSVSELLELGVIMFIEPETLQVLPSSGLGSRRDNRLSTVSIKAWQRLRHYVFKRDGYKCVYCGSPDNLQADHVVPYSKGGLDDSTNLVTACRKCNVRKKDHSVEYFVNKYFKSI